MQKYYIETSIKNLETKYFQIKKRGFDQAYFFITEKNQKKLLNDLPLSADEYLDVNLIDDEGVREEVEFKYKGSNPLNWLSNKKK